METTTTAYIALGSNLGDREATIRAAIARLRATVGIVITRESDLLENPAAGGPAGSPDFLNAVVEIEASLNARDLLNVLLEIERSLGRVRREKWGPRTIDLDLLMFGNRVINDADLKVPHPGMLEREFVLAPLAQIAPNLSHPIMQRSISQLLRELHERRQNN